MWGGARIPRTQPPGPSTVRRSPPPAAAGPSEPAALSFSQLGRTRRRSVAPLHLADYDCSREEEEVSERRRRGRPRASDLWSQPGHEGGEVGSVKDVGKAAPDGGGEAEAEVEEGGVPNVVLTGEVQEEGEGGDAVVEEEVAAAEPQNAIVGFEEEEENLNEVEGVQVSHRASAQLTAEKAPLIVIEGDEDGEGEEVAGGIVEVDHEEVEQEVVGGEQEVEQEVEQDRDDEAGDVIPGRFAVGGFQSQDDLIVNHLAPLPLSQPRPQVQGLPTWEEAHSVNIPTMKHIPKGAREDWSRVLAKAVGDVCSDPHDASG